MNKKIYNLLIIFILLIIFYEILNHSIIINKTIINSSKLWFYNILPSLLPIYIIVDLLINYNILNYFKYITKPINKIFNINNNSSIIFLLSILSGFPSNSKYINTMLNNKLININDANKLLLFTHFSNPLFIINTIGNNFLHNIKLGYIILFSHYFGNIIIGLINRKNSYIEYSNSYKNNSNNFITCLSNSIYNSIKVLILLYGLITIFMILTTIINCNITINSFIKALINSFLEITGGIYSISNLNINTIYKTILISFFLSFGGISIHMQVLSILKDYKINYLNYLKMRLFHGIISLTITYLILML